MRAFRQAVRPSILDFRGCQKVHDRGQPKPVKHGDIGIRQPWQFAGSVDFAPTDDPAVSCFVTADIPEVRLAIKRNVALLL